ncbi:MAG: glycosyltransferase family 2 protein, partial [Nanoarchaeota archaeon]|nr:glycosyltransferase family 2 protein [Nanoarchaeota archaeon]
MKNIKCQLCNKYTMKKTAVIVPAYNEEKNLPKLIKPLKKYASIVIVVDDASKDKTSEIAHKEGAIVLKHSTNKGKGEALKTAFAYIKNNTKIKFIALIDADLQFSPSEILKVLKPLNGIKFVMG